MKKRKVITYGTFDLFHIGHLRLLQRLKLLGETVIVAVSTDEFNAAKGKKCIIPFEQRKEILEHISLVDLVIPESSWEQKRADIQTYGIDVFVMGDDWLGKFDDLQDLCEVIYLPRTAGVSSTEIKTMLSGMSPQRIDDLKNALDMVMTIAEDLR